MSPSPLTMAPERARHALDAHPTRDTFAAGLPREIGAASPSPSAPCRSRCGKHLDHAGADDGSGLFERLEVERRIELAQWQRAALTTADDDGARGGFVGLDAAPPAAPGESSRRRELRPAGIAAVPDGPITVNSFVPDVASVPTARNALTTARDDGRADWPASRHSASRLA